MSSTSEISAKFNKLKEKGIFLGQKEGAERSPGSGGRVQVYKNGRIYWHKNTGAHEVHGGILKKYIREGGPGNNSKSRRRHFGYPITDEIRTKDNLRPVSRFEFGDIIWMNGGITIYSDFHKEWKRNRSEIGSLGYPISEPLSVAGGKAVYFERGCLWQGPATNGKIISCTFSTPLLGKPKMVKHLGTEISNFITIRWSPISIALKNKIIRTETNLLSDIWRHRLALQDIGQGKKIELVTKKIKMDEKGGLVRPQLTLRLPLRGSVKPVDRTLYNLIFQFPTKKTFVVAPHAYYMANDWEKFGFIQATDIHVAKRIEHFQRILQAKPELKDAAKRFNNFNDNFRDFIRYANHLHDIGKLDVILATGDLVDYGFEKGERKRNYGGNYAFFEQLIRGQVRSASGVKSEELRVPIFTIFGNHDYRLNPYDLIFDIAVTDELRDAIESIPLVGNSAAEIFDTTINAVESVVDSVLGLFGSSSRDLKDEVGLRFEEFSPYDISESDVEKLQGGVPSVSIDEGKDVLQVDKRNRKGLYNYYKKRINRSASYTVNLGPHRIVMLDTSFDSFIPEKTAKDTALFLAKKLIPGLDFTEDERRLLGGGPNLEGANNRDIFRLKSALSQAGQNGLVVVGMHGPPLNIENTELAHYFRETEHDLIHPREVNAFLDRNDADGSNADWPRTGTPHFKTGTTNNKLDDGVANDATGKFLKTCTGIGSGISRPVDLVLCGHNHDRIEYRLSWDKKKSELRYHTDFYLKNPTEYYPSKKANFDKEVYIEIEKNAPLNGPVKNQGSFNLLKVPPYKDSLDTAVHPVQNLTKSLKSSWWKKHRPLIVQTAALGPMDHSQHGSPSLKKTVSFQGFRHFQVKDNKIFESQYITLTELRKNNFKLPWERGKNAIGIPGVVVFDSVQASPQAPTSNPKPGKPGGSIATSVGGTNVSAK